MNAIVSRRTTRLPTVSVLIPCYNEHRRISSCLSSLLRSDYPTELIELVVGPYRHDAGSVSVECDGTVVTAEHVRVVGMTLHQLATNAAKYGALSIERGRVAISSRVDDADATKLRIIWSEHGGPPVGAPTRRGFGTRLIEEALAYEVAGSVATLRYPNHGVRCDIAIPLPVSA